jgi:hypothetical protein
MTNLNKGRRRGEDGRADRDGAGDEGGGFLHQEMQRPPQELEKSAQEGAEYIVKINV